MTIIILIPALYNGFPLMYSDTGTYVRSGFTLLVPEDRPIMYGLFTYLTSGFGTMLWGPVIIQSLLAAVVVWRTWKAFFTGVKMLWFIVVLFLLSVGTGLGWHAGRLLPDIFIPLALLSIMDLLFGRPERGWRLFHIFLIMFAGAVHFSSIYIFSFALLVPCLAILRKQLTWYGTVTVVMAMVLSILLTLTMNRQLSGQWSVSQNGPVFLMARLLDTDHFKKWLPEYCATHEHFICAHLEDEKLDSQTVLWNGPLDAAGGWTATRDESEEMVHAYFSNATNVVAFAKEAFLSAAKQLTMWGLDHEMVSQWYRTENAPPYVLVDTYFPQEMTTFLSAKQNGGNGELEMEWVNLLESILLNIGFVLLLAMLFKPTLLSLTAHDRWKVLYVLLAVMIAAAFCATISIPLQRYMARVSWIIPLVGIGMGLRHYQLNLLAQNRTNTDNSG